MAIDTLVLLHPPFDGMWFIFMADESRLFLFNWIEHFCCFRRCIIMWKFQKKWTERRIWFLKKFVFSFVITGKSNSRCVISLSIVVCLMATKWTYLTSFNSILIKSVWNDFNKFVLFKNFQFCPFVSVFNVWSARECFADHSDMEISVL